MFVAGKPVQPSTVFAGKAWACPVKHISGTPLKGKLLALPTNIRLGWKSLPGTNTLAYYENPQITAILGFIVQAPGQIWLSLWVRLGALEWNTWKVIHSGRLRLYPQTLD